MDAINGYDPHIQFLLREVAVLRFEVERLRAQLFLTVALPAACEDIAYG